MKRTELLQEIQKMRFEEAWLAWDSGQPTEAGSEFAAVCERNLTAG